MYTKTESDNLLAGKTNTGTTTALTGRVTSVEDNITLLSNTLGNEYYNKTTTDDKLALKLNLSGGTMTGNLNMGGNRLI